MTFGPYRLMSLLGHGGMGDVWRAFDTRKGREVALKVLPPGIAGHPDLSRRFRREAELAARLSAPHVVPIHDWGDIEGRLFIDMAHCAVLGRPDGTAEVLWRPGARGADPVDIAELMRNQDA